MPHLFSLLREKLKGTKSNVQTFSSWRECKKFFKVLSEKEKKCFLFFLFLFLFSLIFLTGDFYFKNTKIVPSLGGKIVEGVLGQPRFINPVLSPVSDTDRDLAELIFSGLMEYNSEGEIIADLAQNYEIKENGKIWEINLKENLVFQNGTPLTADDVIFTVKTIQNPDYKSPLMPTWLGVEVEKISDLAVRFKLKNPYPAFLESLTLKILPKKIWQEIATENFALSAFNLRPIGSGPYRLTNILQGKKEKGEIESLTLGINPLYHGETPKIKEIIFIFFDNEKELTAAAKSKNIHNFVLALPETLKLFENKKFSLHRFQLPRYFALFFNPKSEKTLFQKEIRQALNLATDKNEIINSVLNFSGQKIDSPLLPDLYGFGQSKTAYKFSLKKANELLDKTGFALNPEKGIREKMIKKETPFQFKSNLAKGSQGTEVKELQKCLARDPGIFPEGEVTGLFGDKTVRAVKRFQEKYKDDILLPADLKESNGEVKSLTRKKLNDICFGPAQELVRLKFTLTTVDDPLLLEVAETIKKQWLKAGIELKIESFGFGQLNQDFLRPRNYQILLFGEVLGKIIDPFPFWHSSQKKDPGLNLALYENKEADKLLEEARQTFDQAVKLQKLEKFQDILLQDLPGVFLYRPDFLYLSDSKIKGIKAGFIADPSQRFAEIQKWYIETKRVWK